VVSVEEVPSLRYGRYIVVDFLGAGGMGQVLRARDPDLERDVAIKVLREPGAEATARLLREARTMAALSHPNVVPIYDVDTDGDEVFIAMELVRGTTLRQWLVDRPRPWTRVLCVFEQAGRGLIAAHGAGLVHRDFKPDNVMIEPDGDDDLVPGRVLVMDFGLARSTGAPTTERGGSRTTWSSSAADDRLTRTGDVLGTPLYLAPEQEVGAAATDAADQYAFCVALYEALFGRRPFRGGDLETLSRQKWAGELDPPPPRSPVPRRVFRAVARGLAVEPSSRWPSMQALVTELERARRPRSRLRGGALVFAAMLGIGGTLGLSSKDAPACSDAVSLVDPVWTPARRVEIAAAFERSEARLAGEAAARVADGLDAFRDAWRAAWTASCDGAVSDDDDRARDCLRRRLRETAALVEVLAHADADVVAHAVEATAGLEDPGRCLEAPAERGGDRRPATGHAARWEDLRAEVQAAWWVGRSAEAAELLDGNRAWLDPIDDCGVRADLAFWRARLEHAQGRFATAIEQFEAAYYEATSCSEFDIAIQAARYLTGVHGHVTGDLEASEVWFGHARSQLPHVSEPDIEEAILLYTFVPTWERSGRMEQALSAMARSRALLEPRRAEEPGVWTEYLTNEASVLLHAGRMEDALSTAMEALHAAQTQYGEGHPSVAMAHGNLGAIFHALSRFDEAVDAHARAAALMPEAFGPEHPYVIKSLVSLAQVQSMVGRWEEAHRNLAVALELAERSLSPDSPDLLRVLRTLSQMHATQGEAATALAHQQRVVDAQDRSGVRDGSYVWDRVKLAEFLVAVGRLDEAQARLDEASEAHESHRELDRVLTGQIHATYAYLFHQRGELARASAEFERAVAYIEPVGGGRIYELGEVLEAYGELLIDAGRRDDAREVLTRAGSIYEEAGAPPEELARVASLLARLVQ
jgi:eukaryotic-like serine/threonine-protein kinase